MKTSYFAKLNKIAHPIAICGWPPKFYHGPTYKALAPKKEWFFQWKEEKEAGKYTEAEAEMVYRTLYYKTVLDHLDPQQVWNDLCALYPGTSPDEIHLLCYEKRGDFCHRHLVAEWLRRYGFDVQEDETV